MLLPFLMVFIFSYVIGFSYYAVAQDATFSVLVTLYYVLIAVALADCKELYFFKLKPTTNAHRE
jgi:hypothetical protein